MRVRPSVPVGSLWGVPVGPALAVGILALLALAALLVPIRLAVLAAVVLVVVLAPRSSALSLAAAAALPVALILAWGTLPVGQAQVGLADCTNPLSPPAAWRLAEALAVAATVVVLGRWLRRDLRELGLRRPVRGEALLSIAALAVIPFVALVIGPVLAEPFFGPIRLEVTEPAAFIPALVLALSNGTLEELAYRGALMRWLVPVAGWRIALVGQAAVFGAAHGAGGDYVGSPLPVIVVIALGGLVAGLIVRRTGSLVLVIAVHAAIDVPLYFYAACRPA